ncbi:MAG: coproporphyrinogen-III oxidase family protein, partial [Alphaproteobacteria bacterium]
RGDARGFGVDLLPPDEVARRLAEHRYGASLPADREPTLFESLRGGRAAIGTGLQGRVAATVPGFVVRLGQDAHLDPGFARDLLERLGVSSDGGESARTGGASRSSRGPRAPSLPVAAPPSLEHIRRALGGAPESAYTTPLVYPWSVQHFEPAPRAPRTPIGPGPFRLYVHVPFCRYHCSFCFYAVRTGAGDDEKARYVDAVLRELEAVEPGTPLSQLFVGGGTPTTLPPGELSRLLGAIFERAPSRPGRVHTIEASPDSLTPEHLDVLEAHGVRRISMGIESLDDSVLATVSRRHGAAQALEACRLVLDRGIALNVDLIYGLPGQTHEGFRRDLERAVDAGVTSLCLYALRLNAHTAVANVVASSERLDLPRLLDWRRFVFGAADDLGLERRRPYFFEPRGTRSLPEQSPDEPLLGVGTSARSQIGDTVFRNLDRSTGYVERIERGESPVETSFRLREGDRQALFVAATLGNGGSL